MDTIGWAGIHDTCTDLCLELGIVKEVLSFPDKVYEEVDHTDSYV